MFLLGSLVDLWVRIPLLIWSFYAQWFWLCDKLVILFVFSQYNLIWGERINSNTLNFHLSFLVIWMCNETLLPSMISVTILPSSRPLSGIPILAIFQNLKCSNDKMTPKNKHTIKTFNLLFPYKSFLFSYGTFRVSYRHFWDILCVQ